MMSDSPATPEETLETPEPQIKTAENIREELKQLKYKNTLINLKDRIEQWNHAHTSKSNQNAPPIPLYWDYEIEEWIWLNREARRQR